LEKKIMVFCEFIGKFSRVGWRSEIRTIIEQRHPKERGVLCAFLVSGDLTRVIYGFFNNQPNATQGINSMVKYMGDAATYAHMFDMHVVVENKVVGRIFV
jgi:hypothetical protein